MANTEDGYFRASAGAVVVNAAGQVLAMRRKGLPAAAWQMPQGGIRFDEAPAVAAWRELREETGLTPDDVELLAQSSQWLVYELPVTYRSAKVGWGQAQRWFLFRIAAGVGVVPDEQEFDAFDWLMPQDLLTRAIEFRVPVYERVFAEFDPWLARLRAAP